MPLTRYLAPTLFAFSLALPGLALANDDMAGMHEGHTQANSPSKAAPMSEGTVKKLDKAAGKITIAHGPLENLNMPAMTMAFRVKDSRWLDKIKEGDKIRFVAEDIKGSLTVVRYEAAQ